MRDALNREERGLSTWIIYLLLAGIALYVVIGSTTFPLSAPGLGSDGLAFSYVGWGMTQGKIPYVDLWDNKGPFLYFLEYVGVVISSRFGIFLIELLVVFFAALFMYRTARLQFPKISSFLGAGFCLILYTVYFQAGNRCEEFALPFIALALYLLLRYVRSGQTTWWRVVLVGVSAGACLLIRLNLAVPIFAACGLLFLCLMFKKKVREALSFLPLFLLGLVVFALPFIIWLGANGAVGAWIETTFKLGFATDTLTFGERVVSMLVDIMNLDEAAGRVGAALVLILFIRTLYVLITARRRKNQEALCWGLTAFAYLVNIPANMLSPYGFLHYYISFIPLLALPAAWVFNWSGSALSGMLQKKKTAPVRAGVGMLMCLIVLATSAVLIKDHHDVIMSHYRSTNDEIMTGVWVIDAHTTREDEIIGYTRFAGHTGMLQVSNRMSATRYFYPPVWEAFAPELILSAQEEIAADIMSGDAKLLILDGNMAQAFYEVIPGLADYVNTHYTQLDYDLQYDYYLRND